MHLFYAPDITTKPELPEDEALHCIRVLRLSKGDEIRLTNGKGTLFTAEITEIINKRCLVKIKESTEQLIFRLCHLHIAIAPTKSMERNEWFAEKATEIGVDEMTFVNCQHSERRTINSDRIRKTVISAIKQAQCAYIPRLNPMIDFDEFINIDFEGQKFIAHCNGNNNPLLYDSILEDENVLVLIGPEGDFSPEEVKKAMAHGFTPVSLGEMRLRTETAGIVACCAVNMINQYKLIE